MTTCIEILYFPQRLHPHPSRFDEAEPRVNAKGMRYRFPGTTCAPHTRQLRMEDGGGKAVRPYSHPIPGHWIQRTGRSIVERGAWGGLAPQGDREIELGLRANGKGRRV
jgi:hypothetical protein